MKKTTLYTKASGLLNQGKIQSRIAELRQRVADRQLIDIDFINKLMLGAIAQARQLKMPQAQIDGVFKLARINGFVDGPRMEAKQTNNVVISNSAESLSDEQLLRLIQGGGSGIIEAEASEIGSD